MLVVVYGCTGFLDHERPKNANIRAFEKALVERLCFNVTRGSSIYFSPFNNEKQEASYFAFLGMKALPKLGLLLLVRILSKRDRFLHVRVDPNLLGKNENGRFAFPEREQFTLKPHVRQRKERNKLRLTCTVPKTHGGHLTPMPYGRKTLKNRCIGRVWFNHTM